ncbi:Protein of unknown function DUF1917 [Penicillium bovifimosum]|uniref:DUF1917-domain-containing protein n=1 Tax=Penicillium bovifimosum TaxID=126998 RepID=A0A9W9GNI6_9EURO|nr:Protein of unknown function DUF1917 [Penicillium bovifimosum]KAJ5124277.1 Protein of unknown function DUF1917 [Penicillium bovifimosum]
MVATKATKETDEIFSDESSFYGTNLPFPSTRNPQANIHTGDEDVKTNLEKQATTYDPEPYWVSTHDALLSTIQQHLRAPPATRDSPPDVTMEDADAEPATIPRSQRGKTEPVSRFLSRLPPSTTQASAVGHFIWMYNPHAAPRRSGDIPTLLRKGRELLLEYEDEATSLREAHDKSGAKTTAPLTRKLNPLRKELEKNILQLGRETGVTDGKWMLFASAEKVDEVWATVVRAMERGELGGAAKVAADGGEGSMEGRLICVYTEDFGDTGDVKRVLRKLVDLGLVGKGKGIFYKCDAFTHLEINSKNEYGLKASMYSSRDMLG